MEETRRNFIKKAAVGAAALGVGGVLPGFSAKSYGRILGANEKLNVGVMGVNARGKALANNFAMQPNAVIRHLCDVDRRDRKSTRLNSSHVKISYAVFCLKKKRVVGG